jgi:hypothetical protein
VTESQRTRLVRGLLLGAVALVLLALVAVAAGGHKVGRSGSSQSTPYAADTILTIILALYAIGAVVVVGAMIWSGLEVRRNPVLRERRRRRTYSSIALTLVAAALLLFASDRFHWRLHLHRSPTPKSAQTPTVPAGGQVSKPRTDTQREAQFRLVPFLGVLGAAALALAAFYVAERRRKQRLPREPFVADDLVNVLDEALDDLRAEQDPRRAVIAAYARMERVLGAHGVPRLRFEAPHEYLARVLAELTGGGRAARRLTALFERARFSPHEVDVPMKGEAIEAVEDLQAELAAIETADAA